MKTPSSDPMLSGSNNRPWLCIVVIAAPLIWAAYFFGSAVVVKEHKDRFVRWDMIETVQKGDISDHCRPRGREPLPKGVMVKTSNLELQPLWGPVIENNKQIGAERSLLTLAVGIKQKKVVNDIVRKFLRGNFTVMLFHYDGVVDEWKNLEWSSQVIHISAVNQTKWWFAKRFLHPDIVSEYEYIFLWDEDIGVENFDPTRYLMIVKDEGLEISQPALDTVKSDVHHLITARVSSSRVHRRMYKLRGQGRCDGHSTAPPCVGWVEMMVPVFSKAAWRCAWHMVQNDLIHAWGLDQLLGYCSQGDRTRKVGVVDSEYIVHLGLPTLGVIENNQTNSGSRLIDTRVNVRQRSFDEMQIFRQRWRDAVKEDQCWVDPYSTLKNGTPS
ncbi:hypothetical protein SAY87_027435 [Trapa incisa]|uniref:Lysine ketoglutarate reductase trans-splicing-like protein n=1 Tax=Trapa incisa TaxID=236973 RepID=A0AAN7GRS0_9MYRT|nr:hypothetical protein SAY87_027435 [Trapa incisa]